MKDLTHQLFGERPAAVAAVAAAAAAVAAAAAAVAAVAAAVVAAAVAAIAAAPGHSHADWTLHDSMLHGEPLGLKYKYNDVEHLYLTWNYTMVQNSFWLPW